MNTFFEKSAFALPKELSDVYDVISCLKYAEHAATYLLREKNEGCFYLLKTSGDPVFARQLANEKDILTYIHSQGPSALTASFPVPVFLKTYGGAESGDLGVPGSGTAEEYPDGWPGETTYYIRTYIKGKTLEELCETNYSKPGLSAPRALEYMLALAELLQFLHGLNPPLIHRDIKPQNVIVDAEGGCHFIDLGISRFYQTSKRSDTAVMGTKLTAPPEQFGYQQTDTRSDLYSLGVLFFYCLTGEYKPAGQSLDELPPDLQHIIRKATMFDPDRRYQSAEELLPDLLAARYPDALRPHTAGKNKRLALYRTAVAVLLASNVMLGIYTFRETRRASETTVSDADAGNKADTSAAVADGNAGSSHIDSREYVFAEPLIEEAVRQQLNIPDGPVTYEDLEKITQLCIFGLQIYSDDSEFWFKGEYPYAYNDEMRESELYLRQGTISSLEDILHMPNLQSLSLYRQQIEDISMLKDTGISHIGLGYNPLTDLTPLTGCEAVKSLNLSCLAIEDTTVLSTLPNLATLNISGTGITSFEGMENCTLYELNLFDAELSDYTQVTAVSSLRRLSMHFITPDILQQLAGAPVTYLEATFPESVSLSDFSVFPQLESLYYCGIDNFRLELDMPKLPLLKSLTLVNVTVSDFAGLTSLSSLDTLGIFSLDCESYDGLDQIPQLRYIYCKDYQKEVMEKQYPDSSLVYLY